MQSAWTYDVEDYPMNEPLLFGLGNANHVFDEKHKSEAFGKNIFTNAFPIALAQYMDSIGLGPICIRAKVNDGKLTTEQVEIPLSDQIYCDPAKARWLFEESYDEYRTFATGAPNRSDIVVENGATGEHAAALEVKLITVPNSATAHFEREQQSCELVSRPPSIEQLCFSIARSFGYDHRHDIGDIIAESLHNPMDYKWSDEHFMLDHLAEIVEAAENVAIEGIDEQHTFALSAIWRTKGQNPVLDDECFDVFTWTDMAFMQLFTSSVSKDAKAISRPARSVIWLVKALFDYSVQGKVTFEKTHSDITFGTQSDKAASFTGPKMLRFIGGETFMHPRVKSEDYTKIIAPHAVDYLKPERRLDAVLGITKMLDDAKRDMNK